MILLISQPQLINIMHYDPVSGFFWWKRSQGGAKSGRLAGTIRSDGYHVIKLGHRAYKAHRLAWFYVYGVWPKMIDHINGVRNDNRLSNLREVTGVDNQANRIGYRGGRGNLRTDIVPPKMDFGLPQEITIEYVRSILHYDLTTGVFYRKIDGGGRKAGDVAITINRIHGYAYVTIATATKKAKYSAARLAWFYVNGCWPDNEIDHINGIKLDNRIENLRDVTSAQNKLNRAPKRNKTGFIGVWKDKKRWATRIKIGGRILFYGCFDTPEQAHEAYMEARKKHYGEFVRTA